jgi:hypothetical protein
MNSRISSLNLDALIKECISKNSLEEGGVLEKEEEVYRDSWNGLVRWVRQQLEVERTVIIPKFL